MIAETPSLTDVKLAEAKRRRLTAMHLQDIESSCATSEQLAMFEMFEREAWSHERRLAYIRERARCASATLAAE